MKLSSRARYALRAMLAISRLADGDHPVSLGKVAESTRLSRRYLEQLAVSLKNASLLRSITGRGGGYLLTRKPDEIKVRHIIEAAIGPISIVDCLSQPESCLKWDVCECRMLYLLINSRIEQVLNEFSLADMAGGQWRDTVARQIADAPSTCEDREPPATMSN